MKNPLPFLVAGSVNGAVYGLAGVGLVFAYRVARTLNFAHGAIAMVAAFSYWQFHSAWGWHAVPSVVLAILLIPAGLGLATERLVFRRLADATVFAKTAASVGLLLALYGLGLKLWADDFVQVPSTFPNHLISLPGVVVSTAQIGIVVTSVALTLLTIGLLRYTRVGLAIRAVVDRRDLAARRGIDPRRISRYAWVASFVLAGLSGLLLGPVQGGAPIMLTLVVIYSLVAAAIGGMTSLGMTMVGGLILGISDSLALAYMPQGSISSYARGVLPLALLFVVLVARSRAFAGDEGGGGAAMLADLGEVTVRRDEPTRRAALTVVAIALGASLVFGEYWTAVLASGVAYAVIFLSYTAFTSTTGLVSLAQGAFAGIGAFTAAVLYTQHGLPWLVAVVLGALFAAIFGALVALPTVRLRGAYLVLATIAFALLVESTIYPWLFLPKDFTGGRGRAFGRPWGFDEALPYLLLMVATFLVLAWGTTRLRRSMVGKTLQADLWTRAGAQAIGIRPERGRLIAFVVAAAMAGLGGAVLSGVPSYVVPDKWNIINAFIWLALVAIGGVGSVWGALVAGVIFSLTPELVRSAPFLEDLYVALFGVAGLLLLRRPGGLAAMARSAAGAIRGRERVSTAVGRGRDGRLPPIAALASANGAEPRIGLDATTIAPVRRPVVRSGAAVKGRSGVAAPVAAARRTERPLRRHGARDENGDR